MALSLEHSTYPFIGMTTFASGDLQTKNPNVDSAIVKQIVNDKYHSIMFQVYGNSYLKYRELGDSAISGRCEISHPIHVDFELFNACNYRCSFCPYSLPKDERPMGFNVAGSQRLDIGLIQKVLREASGRLYAVELGYNTEPLLHRDIVDIIKLCKINGVLDIRMGTNGSLLNRIDNEELIHSGLSQLQVSIDAVDVQSYKKARQSDLYNSVVDNVVSFVKLRDSLGSLLPRIRVTYVMTADNKHGVNIFKEQWADIADIIGFQDLLSYSDANLTVNTEGLSTADLNDFDGCYMPKVRLSIRSDGTVHPCCTVPGMKLRVGNIQRDRLDEIWGRKSMKKIRSSHFDDTWQENVVCRDCVSGVLT